MSTRLYVGNLPFSASEMELESLFQQVGTVCEVTVIQDRFTGKSRGFGFVTMSTEEEAMSAIQTLHGVNLDNRPLTVNEARPREERAMTSHQNRSSRPRRELTRA